MQANYQTEINNLIGIDRELGIYELTDLFYSCYAYHDYDCAIGYEDYSRYTSGEITRKSKTISRLDVLRRMEAARLGSRPFIGNKGITESRPNISMSYFAKIMRLISLPYKSLLTDSDLVKVRLDKRLFDITKLSKREQEELALSAKQNPNLVQNKEVGDDISDAYAELLRISKDFRKCKDEVSLRLVQDGVVGFIHNDTDWSPNIVHAIDLITEPQAAWDPEYWTSFFVIKKMPAQEAVQHIKNNSHFWNAEALRWALNESLQNNGIINGAHYNSRDTFYRDLSNEDICGENYMVKSYYYDKSARRTNIGSYYGNMIVVECYYVNTKGKINKAIIFPSTQFANVSSAERKKREEYFASGIPTKGNEGLDTLRNADILFFRKDVFNSMREAITVIPFNREEPLLERQRSAGHEIFAPIEMISRIDSSIQNFTILMGVPFTKNRLQGTDAQNLEDLEINLNGDMIDLGDRDFVEVPFSADLNSMMAVRNSLIQHIYDLVSIGGLDGNEMMGKHGQAQLANLRLIRDGRIIKQNTESFAESFSELLRTIFRRILDLGNKPGIDDNILLKTKFFDTLTKLQGHPEELFEFDQKDIVPDTCLPYWLTIEMVRSGASSFGPAEIVLFSEIQQIFGAGLDQRASQALNRMGIKSLLGSQDAMDILGDPKEATFTDQDQIKKATEENSMILGSVDTTVLSYEPIPISPAKDDHVLHLMQVHLPKMQQIMELLQQNEVPPSQLLELSEHILDSRVDLILKLGAMSNHVSQHADMLMRFGNKRRDINRLREETNIILQTVEGLMNNLQLTLRARETKRNEKEARLRAMSPESQAERQKLEIELLRIQNDRAVEDGKLALANKIADQKQQQHIDQQVSKRQDRELQRSKIEQDVRQRDADREDKKSIEIFKANQQRITDFERRQKEE